MSEPSRRGPRPDDALPTVEPPSAAFLVQLFVVPLMIVSCGLFVVWGFYGLAQMGNDPENYVRALRRNNEGRWQVALNFANDLRGPGGAALKNDAKLAGDLTGILDDEVASGRTNGSGHAAEQAKKGFPIEGHTYDDVKPVLHAVTENLLLEIHKTFDFFRATALSDRIDRVVLSGGGSAVDGFPEALAERFSLPVEHFDPFRQVAFDKPPAGGVGDLAAPAAVAVGLALRRAGDR